MRLFRTLALEEVGGGFSEDDSDGKLRVVRECVEDVGDLDSCYGSAGCEEEMCFSIVGVFCSNEWGAVDIMPWGYHLQHFCSLLEGLSGKESRRVETGHFISVCRRDS
jgi:hypothetical protein